MKKAFYKLLFLVPLTGCIKHPYGYESMRNTKIYQFNLDVAFYGMCIFVVLSFIFAVLWIMRRIRLRDRDDYDQYIDVSGDRWLYIYGAIESISVLLYIFFAVYDYFLTS